MRRTLDLIGPWAAAASSVPDEVYVLMDSNMVMERRARPSYGSLSDALLSHTNIHACVIPSVIDEILSARNEETYYAQLDRLRAYDPYILPDADEHFHRVTGGSYSTVGPDGSVAFRPELAREGARFDPPDASLLAAAYTYGLPVLTDNWGMLDQRRGHPLRAPAFGDVAVIPIGTRASMSSIDDVTSHLGSVSSFCGLGSTLPPTFDADFHSCTMASLTSVSTNRSALFGGAGRRAAGGAGATVSAVTSVPPGLWGSP